MKYVIYALVILLAVWSVWYVCRSVRRQLRGDCGCGGNCSACGGCAGKKKPSASCCSSGSRSTCCGK